MNSFKMLGSVVVCSALCFATLNANTISKSDADLLFSNVDAKKVAVIDNAEMKNTKGESFLGLAIVAGVTWLGTCFFGECSVDVDLDIRLSW